MFSGNQLVIDKHFPNGPVIAEECPLLDGGKVIRLSAGDVDVFVEYCKTTD